MAYIPTIIVNLIGDDVNFGKITGTFENDNLTSGSENIYYQVVSPSGVTLKAIDHGIPDGTLIMAQPSLTLPLVSLPTVTNGDFEEGVYSLLFEVENLSNPGVYAQFPLTFELDVFNQGADTCRKQALIEYITDCFCLDMTVTDKTDYSDVEVLSREMTIIPPTIPNQAPPVNIVTTDLSVTFPFGYSGVTYQANLYVVYQHEATPAPNNYPPVLIQESLSYTQSEKVLCSLDLCKLMDCIHAFFEKTKTQASKVGGFQNLPFDVLDKWLYINNLLIDYDLAVRCKKVALIDSIFRKLQEVTGCDCGCGSKSSTEIVKLVPLCSSISNYTYCYRSIVINSINPCSTATKRY